MSIHYIYYIDSTPHHFEFDFMTNKNMAWIIDYDIELFKRSDSLVNKKSFTFLCSPDSIVSMGWIPCNPQVLHTILEPLFSCAMSLS
mmetsp:Transcript_1903/g.2601  ORF Transcript_1903/g.2601 Transcript_1903/m.2601 type:complete len:87 (-) Transcript_1903:489-749(-)